MIDTSKLTFNDLDREVATPAGYGRLVGYGRTHVFIMERLTTSTAVGHLGRIVEPVATQVPARDVRWV